MSPAQHERYAGKDVVLRDSMIKSVSAERFEDDCSLLTVDVVSFGYLRIGAALSSEAIVVMVHNGVPASVFLKLSKQGLEELESAFIPRPNNGETDDDVLSRLASSCYRQGGVGAERKKRDCNARGLSTKVAGITLDHQKHKTPEGDIGEEDGFEMIDACEQYSTDPVSGQSGSIAETYGPQSASSAIDADLSLMMAVMAGFHPLQSAYTSAKLHHLISTLSDSMIRKFRIPIERSITAFIVPDSLQILKPDEIFVSFSSRCPIDPITQCPIPHLEGPVLATRSPCKLPTDVRKFTAVYKHELAHLKDCIVMSASSVFCSRSPASFLGGGDYDGDTVTLYWDPALVEPFQNSADHYADVPEGFEETNFEKEVVKVKDFLDALKKDGADEETMIANQQSFLLGALQDDKAAGNCKSRVLSIRRI